MDDLDGRVIVVTGATSGIGRATALALAGRGATVVAVGRDEERLARVQEELGRLGSEARGARCDLSSQAEVRDLAAELLGRHERIHVLVNNAGVVSSSRRLCPDGRELTMAVNHLAPFLLTALLLDRLRESAPARVVTTSSEAHRSGSVWLDDLDCERRWSSWEAYASSKLANVLFTRELARRIEGSGVTANCVHPGVIRSRLGRDGGWFGAFWRVGAPFMGSPRRGARALLHVAADPPGGEVNGGYFFARRPRRLIGQAADDELARGLWERSAQLVGVDA